MTCRRCGSDLGKRPSRGRPALYCSSACRRAAEYELRRVQRALIAVEGRARGWRLGWYGPPKEPPPQVEAELRRLEERLNQLLSDGSTG